MKYSNDLDRLITAALAGTNERQACGADEQMNSIMQ